jgi:hypothetical protein
VASLAAVKEPSLAAPLALAADTYTNTTKIHIIAKQARLLNRAGCKACPIHFHYLQFAINLVLTRGM